MQAPYRCFEVLSPIPSFIGFLRLTLLARLMRRGDWPYPDKPFRWLILWFIRHRTTIFYLGVYLYKVCPKESFAPKVIDVYKML